MNEKTGTEVRLESLEDDVKDLRADMRAVRSDVGFLQRALWWAIGAGTGIGALATSMMSGIIKRVAS